MIFEPLVGFDGAIKSYSIMKVSKKAVPYLYRTVLVILATRTIHMLACEWYVTTFAGCHLLIEIGDHSHMYSLAQGHFNN